MRCPSSVAVVRRVDSKPGSACGIAPPVESARSRFGIGNAIVASHAPGRRVVRRHSHMERFFQFLLIASFIALSWLSFMVVHEIGHVATAWLTGGSVSRV